MQHIRSDQLDRQATPDAMLFGPAKSSSIPFDLSRRLGLSALRSCVDVMLGVVSTMALRAQLTAALTKEAKGHGEWSRCLTKAETKVWARRLTKIAITRYGLEAGEAAKIAGKVASRARKYSHEPRAQARRARERAAKRRESQQSRDKEWMHDHDERQMTWKQIGDRDSKPWTTVRNAVLRLRKRLGLKRKWIPISSTEPGPVQRPSTARGTVNHAPPDNLPSSPRSALAVTTYRHLDRLRRSIERGVLPIDAVMEVEAPLLRRLQSINTDIAALIVEKDTIYGMIACVEAG